MKYVIPLTAALVMGVAVGVHPAFVGPAGPDRRPPRSDGSPGLISEPARTVVWNVPEPVGTDRVPKGRGSEPAATVRKAPELSWRKLSSALGQDLMLTPIQQGSVEQILRERQEEIRTCQDEIRKARVLDMRQYEWQVGRMKERWYRRIDALLDAAQHEGFVAIVEKGFFNEGLGITEEPGLTVLD